MTKAQTVSVLVPLFLVISAGCDSSETEPPVTNNMQGTTANSRQSKEYELHKQTGQRQDPSSPLGYWEINKVYPVMGGSVTNAFAVNTKIQALVDTYACDGLGDETFTANNVYLNNHLFSMTYDAMWMCATMPSPDSTRGALTIRLSDATPINLKQEFINEAAYGTFVNEATEKLNASMPDDCPQATDIGPFFVDSSHIAVTPPVSAQDKPQCEVTVRFDRSAVAQQLRQQSVLALRKN